jgi:spermidine synthase
MLPVGVATLTTDRLTASIVADRGRNGGYSLVIDGVTQSHVNPEDPLDLQLDYVQVIAGLIETAFPAPRPLDALHLGAGGLTVPRYVGSTRPGSRQRVVELFGELLEFVLQNLPLPPDLDVEFTVADARDAAGVAADHGRRSDLIVVDVFSGNTVPRHVSTLEFYSMLTDSLTAEGVLIVNTLTARGLSFTHDTVATLRCLFPHVVAVAATSVVDGSRTGNVVLAACHRTLDLRELAAHAALWPLPAHVYDEQELDGWATAGSVRHDRLRSKAG